jgi:hypothetical protein
LIGIRTVETKIRNYVGSRAGPYILADLHNFADLPRGTLCECQYYEARWNILFNTQTAIVVYQAKYNELWVSGLIQPHPSCHMRDSFTLLGAMFGTAHVKDYLDEADGDSETFISEEQVGEALEAMETLAGAAPEESQSRDDAMGGADGTRYGGNGRGMNVVGASHLVQGFLV